MKKLLGVVVLVFLWSNLVLANSADQKAIYSEYLQKIFYAAEQKQQFQEVCSKFRLGKNQKTNNWL